MKKVKKLLSYVVLTFVAVFVSMNPAFAHSEGETWGHHMAGGVWGWGPMVLFWMVGLLLIALLAVTLIKTLRD
ncbi:MAG: hypothetical protein ABEJ25_00050 [Candidatus Bipolaricaulia bacterium]